MHALLGPLVNSLSKSTLEKIGHMQLNQGNTVHLACMLGNSSFTCKSFSGGMLYSKT